MKTAAVVALGTALAASARPFARQSSNSTSSGPTDTDILQYALTLEHLEDNLYAGALANFSASAFEGAQYPDWVRARYEQVANQEHTHVEILSGALGSAATQACTYNFPYTDPMSFVSLAALIENVGVSAYAGAAQYITNKDYLTLAATILSTEARHQAWESSAVMKANPWSGAFDTALGLDMVYTIASAFITGCPSSNPALPVKAFPALTVTGTAGSQGTFTYSGSNNSSGTDYAAFYNGVGYVSAPISNGMAMIPEGLMGISYVVVTTAQNMTDVSPDNIVAGPAILDYPFPSYVSDPAFGFPPSS